MIYTVARVAPRGRASNDTPAIIRATCQFMHDAPEVATGVRRVGRAGRGDEAAEGLWSEAGGSHQLPPGSPFC